MRSLRSCNNRRRKAMNHQQRLKREFDAALKSIAVRVLGDFLDSAFGPLFQLVETFGGAHGFATGGAISSASFRMADREHVILRAFVNDAEIKGLGQ